MNCFKQFMKYESSENSCIAEGLALKLAPGKVDHNSQQWPDGHKQDKLH